MIQITIKVKFKFKAVYLLELSINRYLLPVHAIRKNVSCDFVKKMS